jgi:CRISPR-associated protein Cas2
MQIVICYDIPDTKRRTRLHKTLKSYGQPVQYSVFECDLSPRQLQRMAKAVRDVIEPGQDNVRYYRLCRSCAAGVEVFGGKPLEEVKAAYVI